MERMSRRSLLRENRMSREKVLFWMLKGFIAKCPLESRHLKEIMEDLREGKQEGNKALESSHLLGTSV
jgi:hypothetical protein